MAGDVILIRNGTLVTASETVRADVRIVGEKVAELGMDLEAGGAEVLDASGRLVFPGGVDPHVHLDLPMFGTVSSDDHYTGHKAAAFGGTTTVLDFVPQIHGESPPGGPCSLAGEGQEGGNRLRLPHEFRVDRPADARGARARARPGDHKLQALHGL